MSNASRRVPDARDEVRDALRAELRTRGAGSGPWAGKEAGAAIAVVADAVERCLVNRLEEVEARGVIEQAALELGSYLDANDTARRTGVGVQGAAVTQRHQQDAAAAHVLLELATRQPVDTGRRRPTLRDLAALAVLAHELWRWRRMADQAAVGLRVVTHIRLTKRGTFDVSYVDSPPFRMSAYENQVINRVVDRNPARGSADTALIEGLRSVIRDGASVPGELVDIDAAMLEDRSYGIADQLMALELLKMASGSKDPSAGGAWFSPDGLVKTLRDNLSTFTPRLVPDRVVAAARRLIWTQQLLLESRLQLLEDRSSLARLYSRPILQVSSGDLFVPRHAPGVAMVVFLARLLEGTWPERLPPADARIERALTERRSKIRPIKGFEGHLAQVLEGTGLPHAVNIGQSPVGQVSDVLGVVVRAEIDAVVASADGGTIWVLEAKDLALGLSPHRIRSELDKYFKPKGHVAKLTAKVTDIAADPLEVLRRLGAPKPSAQPSVRGAFVTREPIPAGFHDQQVHECLVIDRLPLMLGPR